MESEREIWRAGISVSRNADAMESFDEESDISELYFKKMSLPSKMQWGLEKRMTAEPHDQLGY